MEGAFNAFLAGEAKTEEMFKVDPRNNLWLPMVNLTAVETTTGADVYTTLDVNLQDIVETALLRAVRLHQPDWGDGYRDGRQNRGTAGSCQPGKNHRR
ncbi:MAG: hypothetical protein HC821_02645 [Lewinella sp.]|nr:hypothetical protein [Lewinella sp.]